MRHAQRRPCVWRGRPATVARAARGHWVGPRPRPRVAARLAARPRRSPRPCSGAPHGPRDGRGPPPGRASHPQEPWPGPGASVCLLAGGGGGGPGPVHRAPMATGSAACAWGAASLYIGAIATCVLWISHDSACPQGGRSRLDGMHGGDCDSRCAPLGTAHAPNPARPSIALLLLLLLPPPLHENLITYYHTLPHTLAQCGPCCCSLLDDCRFAVSSVVSLCFSVSLVR